MASEAFCTSASKHSGGFLTSPFHRSDICYFYSKLQLENNNGSWCNRQSDRGEPVCQQTLNCDIKIKVLINCWGTYVYIHDAIKALLGVCQTTANDISLLEIGLLHLKHWIKQKQLNFLKQALHHREGLDDDPLMFALSLASAAKTPTGWYVTRLLDEEKYEQSAMIGM